MFQFPYRKIIFTGEVGADNKLPSLDTLFTLNNNSFSTDLYHKKLLQAIIMILVALLRMLIKLICSVPHFSHAVN